MRKGQKQCQARGRAGKCHQAAIAGVPYAGAFGGWMKGGGVLACEQHLDAFILDHHRLSRHNIALASARRAR